MDNKYLETHHKLLALMTDKGIYYLVSARLPLFYIRNQIQDFYKDDPNQAEVLELIDELVKLRTQGEEPRHERGEYV